MLGSEEGHLSGTRGSQGRFSRGGMPELVFKGYTVENDIPGRVTGMMTAFPEIPNWLATVCLCSHETFRNSLLEHKVLMRNGRRQAASKGLRLPRR